VTAVAALGGAVRVPGPGDPEGRLRARLGLAGWPGSRADRVLGWVAPLVVTALGFWLRASGVTRPRGTVKDGFLIGYFDEVYYARDAWSLLHHGVELRPEALQAYVVHPPLGKWLIAAGEAVFGYDELGWRIASVVCGSLMILVFARLVRRATRSTLLGTLGALLLSLDGLQFVQSRISTLDVFLTFWLVCALACLVADRDAGRGRLARRVQDPTRWRAASPSGPRLGVRWWRLGTGFCLGAACATKWSAAPFVVAFALLGLAWDVGARRTAGVARPVRATARRDLLPVAVAFAVLPVLVYTASWTGWFVSDNGYNRHAKSSTLASWIDYHRQALCFHEGLANSPQKKSALLCGPQPAECSRAGVSPASPSQCYSTPSGHVYQSKPFGWLVLARPVAYAYDTVKSGESKDGVRCTAVGQDCSREVLAINTPVLWWAGLLSVLLCPFLWAGRRDWRAALVLVGFAAGFLPWLANTERVMFQFYALPLLPFVVLALVLVLGLALGPPRADPRRRLLGSAAVGLVVLLVLADFAWLHPVLAGDVIPYSAWRDRVTNVGGLPGWL